MRRRLAAMKLDNFIVRPKRRFVERYVQEIKGTRMDELYKPVHTVLFIFFPYSLVFAASMPSHRPSV